jgi:DNA (cytosine-5)-methyltransferase 1
MGCSYFSVDLFAGCGGLSEGFRQAGFQPIALVEMDGWACKSLETRQLYHELKNRKRRAIYNNYVRGKTTLEAIFARFPDIEQSIRHRVIQETLSKSSLNSILERIESSRKYHNAPKFHILLGGPPCQPYSLVGRSRDPDRMDKDKRHYLYKHYLQIMERVQPDVFVYENVPGLFSAKAEGRRIFRKLLNDFANLSPSYEITPPLIDVFENPSAYILNSVKFGIPQNRKRLILVGFKKDLFRKNPALRNMFSLLQKYCEDRENQGYLTVDDAIGDMPQLSPGQGSDGFYSPYHNHSDLKKYQIRMRRQSPGVMNHSARKHMESDLERYRFFIEKHKNGNKAGTIEDLKSERPDLVPRHYHLDKFLDRFKVQWWTHPSSTITAHICKDGHYYIHPDISQCRSFTVREAARCQSFPDNYLFEGPRTSQFMQVGNAVPPLMAKVIGKFIKKELDKIYG